MPEFPVYASVTTDGREEATSGIAVAVAFNAEGKPRVVVDWKSDVAPSADVIEHYRAQVRVHLDVTEAERGLIVLATSGAVIQVTRAPVASMPRNWQVVSLPSLAQSFYWKKSICADGCWQTGSRAFRNS